MPNAKISGNNIGKQVKKARKRAELTQTALSAALEVEHNIFLASDLISRIENGDRAVRDKEIRALCRVLNVSPNDLFGWSMK